MKKLSSIFLLCILGIGSSAIAQTSWDKTYSALENVGRTSPSKPSSFLDESGNQILVGQSAGQLSLLKRSYGGKTIYRAELGAETAVITARGTPGTLYLASYIRTSPGIVLRLRKIQTDAGTTVWSTDRIDIDPFNLRVISPTPDGMVLLGSIVQGTVSCVKFSDTDGAFISSAANISPADALFRHSSGDLLGTTDLKVFRIRASDLTIMFSRSVGALPGMTSTDLGGVVSGPEGSIYVPALARNANSYSVVYKLNGINGMRKWVWSSQVAPNTIVFLPPKVITHPTGDAILIQPRHAAAQDSIFTRLTSGTGAPVASTTLDIGPASASLDASGSALFLANMDITGSQYDGLRLTKVDATTGSVLWSVLDPSEDNWMKGVSNVEVGTAGRVALFGTTIREAFFDSVWTYHPNTGVLDGGPVLEKGNGRTFGVAPLAFGANLLLADSNQSGWNFARMTNQGEKVWSSFSPVQAETITSDCYSELQDWLAMGDSIYALGILGQSYRVVRLSTVDGHVLWSAPMPLNRSFIWEASRIAADGNDLIVLGEGFNTPSRALRLNGSDGSIVWSKDESFILRYSTIMPGGGIMYRAGSFNSLPGGSVLCYNGGGLFKLSAADGTVIASRSMGMANDTATVPTDENGFTYVLKQGTGQVSLEKISPADLSSVFSVPVETSNIKSFHSGLRLLSPDIVGWIELRSNGTFWVSGASTSTGQRLWSARIGSIKETDITYPFMYFAGLPNGTVVVNGTRTTGWFTICVDPATNTVVYNKTRAKPDGGFASGHEVIALADGTALAVGVVSNAGGTSWLNHARRFPN